MLYTTEVEHMCPLAKAAYHGPAPIPEEGKWVQAKEVKDISGFTHGVGWCAPQQGACKLTLNVKEGIIEEALVETLGCSGGQAAKPTVRRLGLCTGTVRAYLLRCGGIRPGPRRWAPGRLSIVEREEISRGLACGRSIRAIAQSLCRAPSTISREVNANGGRRRYRAARADQQAWVRAARPKRCK